MAPLCQHRRKRKLGELGLSSSAGGETKKEIVGTEGKAIVTEAEKPVILAAAPWLAEHYSVRLFDAAWESRHGAAIGLMALFKAWRTRTFIAEGDTKGRQGPWLRRWAEVSKSLWNIDTLAYHPSYILSHFNPYI